ncbi:3-keto-disaccharide hydrolase [Roseimarinus sediminis]|jgi:hypothetical protein|uniref:3-keto-disaccharide hydrolase n=1 Tax=Roseimarinus sediminis TaxID=1610899 RepID=UPI003D1AAE66
MKNYLLNFVFAALLLVNFACQPKGPRTGEWYPLFNGKDLKNWDIKFTNHELGENYKNTFSVEDGLLKVSYDNWDTYEPVFGHLIYKGDFSHYRLRAEYRFVGEQIAGGPEWAARNNGLMIHCQAAKSIPLDQAFPVSIEVQLLGGDGINERSNMNVCTPGTHILLNGERMTQHCIDSKAKTYHGEQWVSVEVEVRGAEIIRHLIDGEVVLEYSQPQLDADDPQYEKLLPADGNPLLKNGSIALQAESHPTQFRKVEIMLLD